MAEMENGHDVLAALFEGVVVTTLALLQLAGVTTDVPSSCMALLARSVDLGVSASIPVTVVPRFVDESIV